MGTEGQRTDGTTKMKIISRTVTPAPPDIAPTSTKTVSLAFKPTQTTTPTGGVSLVEVAAGFYQEPLIVCTYGDPGSGKSRLCGTAPGIIAILPTEHKSRQ